MHPNALLDLTTELLRSVLKLDAPADGLVSQFFRKHRDLGARERHTLAETTYGVLRQRHRRNPPLDRRAGQGRVTRLAGGVFRAFATGVVGLHAHHVQRHAQRGAGACAVPLEIVGRSLQAMVNMNCADPPGPLQRRRMQQGGRVGAAAVGHTQGCALGKRALLRPSLQLQNDGIRGRAGQASRRGLTWSRRLWCR